MRSVGWTAANQRKKWPLRAAANGTREYPSVPEKHDAKQLPTRHTVTSVAAHWP